MNRTSYLAILLILLAVPVIAGEDSKIEDQIRELIPAATAIDREIYKKIVSGKINPIKEALTNHSLTAELMVLSSDVVRKPSDDFRYLTEVPPKPTAMASEMYRSLGIGNLALYTYPVTMIHEDRITQCQVDIDGERAAGTFKFQVPDLYEGQADFVAERKESDWRLVAFRMNGLGIHIRRDNAGQWWRAEDLPRGELPVVLRGHQDTVWDIDFDADGTRLASCSSDRSVRIWQPATGQELLAISDAHQRKPPGIEGRIVGVDFSPDGKHVASTGDDGNARIWDAKSGEMVHTLPIENLCSGVCFSPDGKRVLFTAGDITVWNAETWEKELSIGQHSFPCAVFSPDGKQIASVGAEAQRKDPSDRRKTVRLWDASTGESLATSTEAHEILVTGIAVSPDGKQIATVGRDKTIRIWDASSAQQLSKIEGHEHAIHAVAFSPNGKWIATGDTAGSLKVWNAETREPLNSFPTHPESIRCIVFSPDGKALATAGRDAVIRIWDFMPGGNK